MHYYKIKKTNLSKFIESLMSQYDVYGPKKMNMDFIFSKLEKGIEFFDVHTILGPKEQLYPSKETLFKIVNNSIEVSENANKKILIGTKSCDIQAFKMLDDVFLGEYKDQYYAQKRENSIIFNFSCIEPCKYGFCTTFEGPRLEKGFDLQFTDIGDYYLIESLTEKFRSSLFESISDWEIEESFKNTDNVYKKMKRLSVVEIHKKLAWDDPVWSELGARCISCGACNYACPTCFCFAVSDRITENVERVREWDSCLLAGFTSMATFTNSRSNISQRMRQRFMHKLKYHFENYNYTLCTGCGRCVETCPVEIDIRSVISHFEG